MILTRNVWALKSIHPFHWLKLLSIGDVGFVFRDIHNNSDWTMVQNFSLKHWPIEFKLTKLDRSSCNQSNPLKTHTLNALLTPHEKTSWIRTRFIWLMKYKPLPMTGLKNSIPSDCIRLWVICYPVNSGQIRPIFLLRIGSNLEPLRWFKINLLNLFLKLSLIFQYFLGSHFFFLIQLN